MMKTEELKIEGMTCGHCVMSVKKELSNITGVHVVDVRIGTARVEYDSSIVDRNDLVHAIEEAGYQVAP